jgi:MFS family permease
MITAFVDMVGLLMVIPLLPFLATRLGGGGFVVGVLVSAFSLAQLLSAPLWGRFSDRYGRRPALLVALGASAVAYVMFAYAGSLLVLLLSRVLQGAGGGTVGVLQAYVADTLEPRDRAKGLGWISAATSLGVMVGPALGAATLPLGPRAPGLAAAVLCAANMVFAWAYLRESRVVHPAVDGAPPPIRPRQAVRWVLTHPGEAAPRLIWIYAIGIGAFMGFTAIFALFLQARFGVTEKTIFWAFVWNGLIAVLARAWLLGKLVDRLGEARTARFGQVLLLAGLVLMPFTWRFDPGGTLSLFGWTVEPRLLLLAAVIALVPLGTAFTFPCVTGLLSQVIEPRERGVMMGVQQTFGGAARVVFPMLTGWAFELGTGYPFWISAAFVFATLFLSVGIEAYARKEEEPAREPSAEEVAVATTP